MGDGRLEKASAILTAEPIPSTSLRDVQRVYGYCILDIEELRFGNEVEVLAFNKPLHAGIIRVWKRRNKPRSSASECSLCQF